MEKSSQSQKVYCLLFPRGGKYKVLKSTTSCTIKHKNLKSGTTYSYKIKAINGKKESSFSAAKTIKTISKSTPKITLKEYNNSIAVRWNKIKNATGYIVYRKTNGGYKKITTTQNCFYKNVGIDIATTYKYKVVPYIKSNNKNILGKSSVKTITTKNYGYLLDLVKPYDTPHHYEEKLFEMGGESYNHGFTCLGYGDREIGNVTFFNLKGKYTEISFVSGICDNNSYKNDANVYIYADGDLILNYKIKADNLPKKYTIDVTDCAQLKISVYSGSGVAMYDSRYGFANIVVKK